MPQVRSDGGALDPDGPIAAEIAWLWWFLLVLGVVAFAVFAVALAVALRRRRERPDDTTAPTSRSLRRLVIGGGVMMPAVVLTAVLVFTVETMRAVPASAPAGALEVEVTGHQWWWEIRYPEHGITTANELHLPVGQPVEVRLTSDDVIHSLWIPALAGKMDLLPDDVNTLVLEADEAGVHRTQCNEFCGLQHAKMRLLVVVEPEADFLAWVDAAADGASEPTDPVAMRGHEVFFRADCASCHAIRGTEASGDVGPDLTHVASRETIGAGTLPLTHEHLGDWIRDPHAFKRGVDMPANQLSDDQLQDLVAYLETLR